jgi:hypothetical protein
VLLLFLKMLPAGFWIWFELPLLILMQLLEDASYRCILSVIFNVIRLYRVYPCCPTSAPQS